MDELVERVRQALEAEYPGAPNGRVRDVPDRRAIRWYTTIGLVDRPLGMRGRTALYGPRHLQQLVAIKRWQAEGRSLAEIQADFVWLSPEALSDASRVPEQLLTAEEEPVEEVTRPRFWADRPAAGPTPAPPALASPALAPPALASPALAPPAFTSPALASPAEPPVRAGAAAPVHGVTLGGGAILLLPHPASDTDRGEIATAAAPLLRLLESRGLIDGSSQ
ncbi:MerR family transcriptional regulator [Actinoplanes sp. NPDC026619]|uniref:MerR family transcriptional regulator n=1 Tax=Actinoplanes sp. NPDC026619 TaxID=3155798 RepID=UPI0033E7E35C